MSDTEPTDVRHRCPCLEPLEPRRLLAAGDLDPTFGDGGTVTLRIGEYSRIGDLVILDDGRIIASVVTSGDDFLMAFHPDGSPDPTFGIDGRLPSNGDDLERLPDGDVLAIGHDGVRRYNADFTLDPAFGDAGLVRTAVAPEDAAIQPDGKLLVVARNTLTRYHADGRLDTSFGDDGTVRPRFRDLYRPEDLPDFEFLIGVDVQPGGNIIVGGGITFDTETPDGRTGAADFTFTRYLPDGQPDLSFGSRGRFTFPHHDHDAYIDDFAMRPDGSIVMAGGGLYGDGRTILVERDAKYALTVFHGFYEPRVAVRDDGTFAVIDWDSFAIIESDHDRVQGLHQEFLANPKFHAHDRYPHGFAVAYQPDGKLVAAGQSDNHLALVRLQPSPIEQDPFTPRDAAAGGQLIQAEEFDFGGEGTSYHDADPTNHGNAYRSSGVDIGPTSDTGGGHAVGWTQPGEWLEYTIEVHTPATYNILTRVANTAPGAAFHIELDGLDITGPIAVPDTGSWHHSRTVASKPVHIPAGTHTLRLAFDKAASNGAVGNFNWLRLRSTAPRPVRPPTRRPLDATASPPSPSSAPRVLLSVRSDTTLPFQRRRPIRVTSLW